MVWLKTECFGCCFKRFPKHRPSTQLPSRRTDQVEAEDHFGVHQCLVWFYWRVWTTLDPAIDFLCFVFAAIGFFDLAPHLVLSPGHAAHCVGWHHAGFVSSKVARAFSQRLGNFLCQYWMVVVLSAPPLFWNVLTNVCPLHTCTHTQIYNIHI